MNDEVLVELLREVRGMREALTAHIAREDELLPRVMDGVPNGDWHAHKEYHQALIERAQDRAQMWREMRNHVAKVGAWALVTLFFVWVGWTFKHWRP